MKRRCVITEIGSRKLPRVKKTTEGNSKGKARETLKRKRTEEQDEDYIKTEK